jgi:hypothetical protein
MVLKTLQLCQVQLLLGILLLYSCNSVHEVASIASQQETKSQKWHHWLLEKDNLDRLNRTVFTLIISIYSGLNSQGYLTACWEFEEACRVFRLPKWSHAESSCQEGLCAHQMWTQSKFGAHCIYQSQTIWSDCYRSLHDVLSQRSEYESISIEEHSPPELRHRCEYNQSLEVCTILVVGIIGILYGKFLVMPLRQNRFNETLLFSKSSKILTKISYTC